MEFRRSGRVTPPGRVIVTIADGKATALASGIVTDLSTKGARIWSTAPIPVGATLRFTLEFTSPPGEYEFTGRVVWARNGKSPLKHAFHLGVEWLRSNEDRVPHSVRT